MMKDILALVGLFAISRMVYHQFDRHLRKPLERVIAEALEEEQAKEQVQ